MPSLSFTAPIHSYTLSQFKAQPSKGVRSFWLRPSSEALQIDSENSYEAKTYNENTMKEVIFHAMKINQLSVRYH